MTAVDATEDTTQKRLTLSKLFTDENKRASMLHEAESLVNGDRNVQYGDPKADFARSASYWNTHFLGVLERKLANSPIAVVSAEDVLAVVKAGVLDAHDIAIMQMLLKCSRLAWSPEKRDSWVDSAGYAACGYDAADTTS